MRPMPKRRTPTGDGPARMLQDEERRLINRYQHGDSAAAGLLIAQHQRALRYMASHVTSRCESEDDLFQEACIAFLISVRKYRLRHKAKPRLTTWCYQQVRRELYKHCLMAGVIRLPSGALLTDRAAAERAMGWMARGYLEIRDELARDYREQEPIDDAEEREVFDRAMFRLSARHRRVVEHRLLGRTYRDIGDLMGISKERVRQILDKAIERLSLYCNRRPLLLA